ncbi:MAG: radical SAM protein [Bacteroidales bacterium]|jgi:MoaA/NifB/PqqE/SkfB family radical SAM enzyme|nr:radical SAM protein [Bacteroidales bacterium]
MRNDVKKIVLFGAGKIGIDIFKKIQYRYGELNVEYFADNDILKQGRTFLGKKVLSANEAINTGLDIYVTTDGKNYTEIKTQLCSLGYVNVHKYQELFGEETGKRYEIGLPLRDVVPLKAPAWLFIDVSGRCNYRCVFCPHNNSKYMWDERHKQMSFEIFQKIVNDLREFEEPIGVIDLSFITEPLLHPDLPEMLKILNKNSVCKKTNITTNGCLLTPELNDKLIDSGLNHMLISVEALNKDQFARICGVAVDFEKFVFNIADLYNKAKGKMVLEIRIFDDTFEEENDYILFEKTFGSISDYHHVRHSLSNQWPGYQYEFGNIKNTEEQKFSGICTLPLIFMVIFSNGDVGICPRDWCHATKYGHVMVNSIKDLWQSEALKKIRIEHLTRKRNEIIFCKDCARKSVDDIHDDIDLIKNRLTERCNEK